jgi:hypothetical protein
MKKSDFHVAAKQLVKDVRNDSPIACARARTVFRDLAGTSDAQVKLNFSLGRAQYVVAKELGFADWGELVRTELR